MKEKNIICLCGEAASGKDTLMRELVKEGLTPVLSYTTRPIRKNEVDGVDYNFITLEEFKEKELIEKVQYRVNGETWYYGFPVFKVDPSKTYVLIINPIGLSLLKQDKRYSKHLYVVYLNTDETIRHKRYLERENYSFKSIINLSERIKQDREDFQFFVRNYSPDKVIVDYCVDKVKNHKKFIGK